MDQNQVMHLWNRLGASGTAPTDVTSAARVLPSYTAGIQPWINRLSIRYLRGSGAQPGLCQSAAHFKLVLAPYGGGKTHFLMTLGARALDDGFAVSYVPCTGLVSLDNPLDIHRELIKNLQLPGKKPPGLQSLIDAVIQSKRREIEQQRAPDLGFAFSRWISTIRRDGYPENSFGDVMATALDTTKCRDPELHRTAFIWLQGDEERLTSHDRRMLRLAKISNARRKQFGRELMLSTAKFLPNAGVRGLVLLIDEAETMFAQRNRTAVLRILAAMRVMVDIEGIPLLCVVSATRDVLGYFERYPALGQRLAVVGRPFDAGNDLAPQLALDKVRGQEEMLLEIGNKLIEVGTIATGHPFNFELQKENCRRLVKVASSRDLDIDARRMFVKTWVSLLQSQVGDQRVYFRNELDELYMGNFTQLDPAEEFEP